MPEIPYGRLQALESALGGRERINSAWQRGVPLIPDLIRFPFAHDTPGLTDGVVVYTPTPGEVLLDAWFEILTPWNGTTPQADIGTYVEVPTGLFFEPSAVNCNRLDSSGATDEVSAGRGLLVPTTTISLSVWQSLMNLNRCWDSGLSPIFQPNNLAITAPARFIADHPLKVVVSQDANAGGADPGATQGDAILSLLIAPA